MAQRIEGGSLPPKTRAKRRSRGRTEKYPWSEWFDGELWRLTKGQDFDVGIESFRTAALGAAKNHGVTLGTRRVSDQVILLKVTGIAPPKAVRPKAQPKPKAETDAPKRRFSFFR